MNDPLAILSERQRSVCRNRPMPHWVEPMLATLSHSSFSDANWLYEPKLDGVRCLAMRDGDRVDLYTRNRKHRNVTYPELIDLFSSQEADRFILDGEIVAIHNGISSFSRLQERANITDPESARNSDVKVYFYAFDCPWIAGYDLQRLPLRDRKRVLKHSIDFSGALGYTQHRNDDGEAFLQQAREKGWEGLIAKQAASSYEQGRSRKWLKFRVENRQEFIVAGYTDPEGSRTGFGALLLGYYEDNALRYAGKVGTGFDESTLRSLHKRLARRTLWQPPFHERVRERGVHWVEPALVAEIAFTEWTHDDKLRHPRFLGMRDDKAAEDVIREKPEAP